MPKRTVYTAKIEHVSILNEEGELDTRLAKNTLTDEDVVFLYEQMCLSRHYDEIAFKLQRSGRMGTYPQNKGQEAGPAAAGLVMKQRGSVDWIAPCYRENLALFLNGLPMESILLHWMGDERGNKIPEGVHILPMSIPIGTHPLHAAGLAWAAKYRGEDRIATAFFGDGATSEGDVHEAMNFASALKLPCVFFCQNNKWAISVPSSTQTASETFAQKGLAYGHHCVQVDGNDIFACYKVYKEAVDRARMEHKPTMIEALTYRLGDHTTADDARRYRDQAEVDEWAKRDPLIRTRKYLEGKGLWDDDRQAEMDAKSKELVSAIVKRAEGIEKPQTTEFFDDMFAVLPDELVRQRETMRTSVLGQRPQTETLAGTPAPAPAPAHA